MTRSDRMPTPRDTMTLRLGEPSRIDPPDARFWVQHCAQLQRRAAGMRASVEQARLHGQRAYVLDEMLDDRAAAEEAWKAALVAQPGYLPALLALRDRALESDARSLAETLADVHLPALADSEDVDRRDIAELAAFFGLIWLFRWPDADRAAHALLRLEAVGDPLGLAERLLHLCLDGAGQVTRWRARAERLEGPERAALLAELGRHLVDDPDVAAEGWQLLAEAAGADPVAGWYRVEQALVMGEPSALARALETLAGLCEGVGAAILRFLAAEIWELVLGQVDKAEALYAQVTGGGLRAAIALKQIVSDARQFSDDPLGMSASLAEQADSIGDARLEAVLYLRAAQLAAVANDSARARDAAGAALERWPEDDRARHLVERIVWQAAEWHDLRALINRAAGGDIARLLRAAILEHAVQEPASALGALGSATSEAPELLHLRTRQRLSQHLVAGDDLREAEARVRAWQYEANLLDASDRRAELYLRIARFYLAHTAQHEKALTYLFWALDRDPKNLTVLRIIEHCCRQTGRQGPLVKALDQTVELLDRPADRFPLRRELAEIQAAAGAPTDTLVDLYRAALAEEPTDASTQADLERLYRHARRHDDLKGLYEQMLRSADGPEARASVAVRFGPLLVEQFDDAVAALRLYDRVMPDTPDGPLRSRLEMLQTEAAAAGGLSGSLPALNTVEIEALERSSMDFDFGEADIDELLTVVSDPRAESDPGEIAPPPLPPLLPMAPTEVDSKIRSPLPTDEVRAADAVRPADRPSGRTGLLDSGRAAVPPPLDVDDEIEFFEFEVDEDDAELNGSVELSPEDLAEAGPPPPAPITDRTTGFLGAERAGEGKRDRSRAVIARKLRRSRNKQPTDEFADFGEPSLVEAVEMYGAAEDFDTRLRAVAELARRYEAAGRPLEAIRAWRTVLGFRAGDGEAIRHLEQLYRSTEDWRGLVEILAGEATRTGDRARRQALLLEVARLEWRALEDAGAAVNHFLEALDLGVVDRETIAELAGAVRAVKRWPAYVDALARAGLDDPAHMSPEGAIDLGRVHLYELSDPARAVPYLVTAARALPERVDIAADLAEARAGLGEVDRAVALLTRAIQAAVDLGPDARNVLRLRLARLYEEHAADSRGALHVYRDALAEGLSDPAVLDRVDHLATAAEDWHTLAAVLERNLEEARGGDPEEVRPIAIRQGQLLLKRLERPREAATAFVEAYVLDPADEGVFRLVEGILRKHPDPALQARLYAAWLDGGERSLKERLTMSLRLVAAHEAEGRLDAAAEVLEELRARMPNDGEVLAALERVYQKAGRWDELVQMYHQALDTTGDPQIRGRQLRRLARAYEVGLRDLPRATEVYQTLFAEQPDDTTTLKALARLLEGQKRWDELLEISTRELALTDKPRQKAFIHFRMGSLHESQLGDHAAAGAAYHRALELDPRCFPALHGLRELAANAGDWPTVVAHLGRELELWDEPKERAAVLSRIGEIYERQLDDTAEADAHYARALDTHAGCIPAARALARRAWQAGDWEAAAPHLQVLTNQNLDKLPRSTSSKLFYRRGVVARNLGRQLEAIESLKLALEFDGSNAEALHALVETYAGQGTDDDGLSALLKQLAENRATHVEAGRMDEVARIDVLSGLAAEHQLRLDDAEDAYRRACEARPDDPDVLRPLIELLLKRRLWSDATAALRTFADRFFDAALDRADARAAWVDATFWEGEIWSDMAVDPARAIACYAAVLAVDPDNREARYRTAQCHYLMGVFDEAAEIVDELLTHGGLPAGERARYTFYRGRIEQVGLHDEGAARALYAEALQVDRHCARALIALGRSLLDADETDGVVDLLREHQALIEAPDDGDPDLAALKTFAAGVWHRHGQSDVALRLLTPLAQGITAGARDARFCLARVHESRGGFDAAAAQLERTLADDVCDIAALRALAGLRMRQGDDERALWVLSVLELYGALNPDERVTWGTLRDRNRKQRDRGGHTLADGVLERVMLHPSFKSPLVTLMALCADDRPIRPPPTLRRAERVNGQRHTFTLELEAVQSLLGYRDFDLYFIGDHPELVALWPAEPPLMVLGAPALGDRCTTAERRFLVGRAAFYGKAGLTRLHDAGPEQALDRIARVGGLVSRRADLDRRTDPLLAGLPDRAIDTIAELVQRVGEHTLPPLYTGEQALTGVACTADRAGLLASGSLRAAVEMLTRHAGVGETIERGDDLGWAVRSGSRLRDLVKYALSDAFTELRAEAGLGIS